MMFDRARRECYPNSMKSQKKVIRVKKITLTALNVWIELGYIVIITG